MRNEVFLGVKGRVGRGSNRKGPMRWRAGYENAWRCEVFEVLQKEEGRTACLCCRQGFGPSFASDCPCSCCQGSSEPPTEYIMRASTSISIIFWEIPLSQLARNFGTAFPDTTGSFVSEVLGSLGV